MFRYLYPEVPVLKQLDKLLWMENQNIDIHIILFEFTYL